MDEWKSLGKPLPPASDVWHAIQEGAVLRSSTPLMTLQGDALPLRVIVNASFIMPRPEISCSLLCSLREIPKIGTRVFGLDVVDPIEMHPIPPCFEAMGFPNLQGSHKQTIGYWDGAFHKLRFGEQETVTHLEPLSILDLKVINVILSEFFNEIRVQVRGDPIPDQTLYRFIGNPRRR